jgi:DNA-binding NtrC family response regulator
MTSEQAVKNRVGEDNCEPVVADQRMMALMETATRAAASDAKVLITGESGVGKDLIASHLPRC